MNELKLFHHPLSGHSHRVEMFLSILGLKCHLEIVDLRSGEHRKSDFKKINCFSQVPVLKDGDTVIADSNAILVYLAKKYGGTSGWLPEDALLASQVQRFLSLAASRLASGPAIARAINVFGAPFDIDSATNISDVLFLQFNEFLDGKQWIVGGDKTIADLAMYTYTKHAPEGGINMSKYSNIEKWLRNVEAIKGFIPMEVTHTGLLSEK